MPNKIQRRSRLWPNGLRLRTLQSDEPEFPAQVGAAGAPSRENLWKLTETIGPQGH